MFHILQALQGRDTSVFTDKVSTGHNSNIETRIKKSSAHCRQQELPQLQSFLTPFIVVFHTGALLGHFTEGSVQLSWWGQVSCSGQQKGQQQQRLLKNRAGKLSPLSCEPPKANLSDTGQRARLGGDPGAEVTSGTGTPKPASHSRALLHSDLGSVQLHCLKTKK